MIPMLLYFGLCILIGLLGKQRAFGFWGFLFISILTSPLIGFVILLISRPEKRIESK